MGKPFYVAAVMSLFAATAASAQSSATVYGIVDAGLTRESGASGSITKLATGVQSGNRLGFKGTEELGNGLKANFQLESGFDLDTGTSRQGALFGRQAYVGLSGLFGAVNLGHQYDPIYLSLDSIDPFGLGLPGQVANLMNTSNIRTDNAITYSSVPVHGFSFNGLYGMGEMPGNRSANKTLGASANYINGPVFATLAYDKLNNDSRNPASAGHRLVLLGATYNLGPVLAHAGVETEKGIGASDADFRSIMVGASIPVGRGSIMASVISKTDRCKANRGAKQVGIGYLYSLSTRSKLYTSYARIDNQNAASYAVGDASGGGSAVERGQASSAFTVGMNHKF
ncbi:porin [Massilia sp. LXY-6]|uniref:porin n=1 Tax=Massilia sp. LXY-6 TaxID=3379823 RepID=UPI003EE06613